MDSIYSLELERRQVSAFENAFQGYKRSSLVLNKVEKRRIFVGWLRV